MIIFDYIVCMLGAAVVPSPVLSLKIHCTYPRHPAVSFPGILVNLVLPVPLACQLPCLAQHVHGAGRGGHLSHDQLAQLAGT